MVLILAGLLGSAVRPAVAQSKGGGKSSTAADDAAAAPSGQDSGEEPSKTPAKAAAPGKPAAKPVAAAPEYVKEPVEESQKKLRTAIVGMLRAGAFQPGEEAQFDAYYTKYALPRWTVPENYAAIASKQPQGYRDQLRVELITGRQGPPYDKLVQHTLTFAKKVVADKNYHPAVRVNAMLAVGDLNVEEPPPGPNATVRPHLEGLRIIVQSLNDADQIDAVRVAALQGLVRHCKIGLPNQARNQVEKLLLDYVTAKTPPEGRSAQGHAWMRALAIEALAGLKSPGANGAIVKTLMEVVTEKAAPIQPTRLAAVKAFGVLDYQNLTDPKPVDVAKTFGQLVLEACITEIDRKDETAATSPAMGGGMYGGMPGMPGMGSGSRMGMSSGSRMGMSSGPGPGMSSGSRMGMSSGSRMGMSSGPGPGMSSGPRPPSGPGSRPPGGPGSRSGSSMMGPGMMGPGMMGPGMMGPGMMGPGGMGPGMGDADEDLADDPRAVLFRRRLKMVVGAVQVALSGERRTGGVAAWAEGTPDKKAVDLLSKYVALQIKDLDEEEKGLKTLKTRITARRGEMKKWVADPNQAVAEAEKAEADKKKGK